MHYVNVVLTPIGHYTVCISMIIISVVCIYCSLNVYTYAWKYAWKQDCTYTEHGYFLVMYTSNHHNHVKIQLQGSTVTAGVATINCVCAWDF